MSSSGLIYAAIIGAWAVYFLTRSLRSGADLDPAAGSRCRTAAVLARRNGSADGTRWGPPEVALAGPPGGTGRRPAVSRATACRRRRVTLALLLGILGGLAAAAATATPSWAPVVPAGMLVLYLGELRVRRRRSRSASRPAPEVGHRADAAHRPEAAHLSAEALHLTAFRDPSRRPRWLGGNREEVVDLWPSFDEASREEAAAARTAATHGGEADPPADSTGGPGSTGAWEPVRVPLPTYVTAPKAPERNTAPERFTARRPPERWTAAVRTIDVSTGRAWTSPPGTSHPGSSHPGISRPGQEAPSPGAGVGATVSAPGPDAAGSAEVDEAEASEDTARAVND